MTSKGLELEMIDLGVFNASHGPFKALSDS